MSDCIVIGGGIIGLTSAYELTRHGATVTVFDQSQTGREASWAGAGMLPPADICRSSPGLAELTRFTHSLWPELTQRLFDETGVDNGFLSCGGLEILSYASEQQDDLNVQGLSERWREQNVDVELVEGQRLHNKEPELSNLVDSANYLPEFCQVRNPWHLRALRMACEQLSVQFREHQRITSIDVESESNIELRTEEGVEQADACVVAAGAWSAELLASCGIEVPLEPVRGQIVLLNTGRRILNHVIEYGKMYLVPRNDSRVLIGATEEWAGFEKRNTAAGVQSLIEFACQLVPALKDATIEKCWSGLRPCCSDRLPIIDRLPSNERVIVATGHYRYGLHLSAATGHLVRQLVMQESPDVRLEDFSCGRFAGISTVPNSRV